jgi:hypothetical protein
VRTEPPSALALRQDPDTLTGLQVYRDTPADPPAYLDAPV